MRNQRRGAVILAIAVAGSMFGAVRVGSGASAGIGPAAAKSPGDTSCTSVYEITATPGLSLTPSRGTYTTGGDVAEISCTGTVNGKTITGVGALGETGRYGVMRPYACTDAEGDAVQRTVLRLPTADGPVRLVDDTARISFGPLRGGGAIGGTVEGRRFYGSFTALPLAGDCVTSPITRVQITLQAWIVEDP